MNVANGGLGAMGREIHVSKGNNGREVVQSMNFASACLRLSVGRNFLRPTKQIKSVPSPPHKRQSQAGQAGQAISTPSQPIVCAAP